MEGGVREEKRKGGNDQIYGLSFFVHLYAAASTGWPKKVIHYE